MSPWYQNLIGWGATLALGATGGGVFNALGLPLPWMLGALLFCLIGALAGLPLRAPAPIRPWVVAVIGVMLGASFHAETFSHAWGWIASLLGLVLSMALSAALVVPLFIRFGGMSPATALFAAMPGGLSEMVEIGRAYGGDERMITLAHTARIILVIAVLAVWFRLVLGLEVQGVAPLGKQVGPPGLTDSLLLLGCGVIGAGAGRRIKLPAPTFLGPMALSALVHVLGWTDSSPPSWLVISAQIALGSILGSRFVGVPVRAVGRALMLGLVATGLMLTVVLALAVLLHGSLGQDTEQVVLAYAPGGLTEMSLIALSMGADVAYVATHHLVRIILLMALASSLIGAIAKRLSKADQAR